MKIAITHGDINGINYELLLKVFSNSEICQFFTPIIYGSAKVAGYYRKVLRIESDPWNRIDHPSQAKDRQVNIINCLPDEVIVEMGKAKNESGEYALMALDLAMEHVLSGEVDAITTLPINKSTMPQDKFPYAGHTSYLEQKAHSIDPKAKALMILMSGNIRVALATEHIAVDQVARRITQDLLIEKLQTLNNSLIADFAIDGPRIAVYSLNPHAGDNGLIGKEENEIIIPALEEIKSRYNIAAFGPYASDGLWGSNSLYRFDAQLAMYHDQGLTPFKALFMDSGVNYTAGLPFVRTSPDHGPGYDITGKGIANEASFREAIYAAIDIVRNRSQHKNATANPLKKGYFPGRNDTDALPIAEENDDDSI